MLSFRNASNERRRIYWLDQNGKRKFYGIVEPQHILQQPTYPGYAWLVTDEAEKCLSVVTATSESMTVDIGGGAVGASGATAAGTAGGDCAAQPPVVRRPAPQEQADAAAPERRRPTADQVPPRFADRAIPIERQLPA